LRNLQLIASITKRQITYFYPESRPTERPQ
jgi:hypothetical protein